MSWFWNIHSHFLIGKDYLEKVLLKKIDKSEAYARVLSGLGRILWVYDAKRGNKLMNESLDIFRKFRNQFEEAIVLSLLGSVSSPKTRDETILRYNEESLKIARNIGNTLYVGLDIQGVAFSVSGQSRWAKSIRVRCCSP